MELSCFDPSPPHPYYEIQWGTSPPTFKTPLSLKYAGFQHAEERAGLHPNRVDARGGGDCNPGSSDRPSLDERRERYKPALCRLRSQRPFTDSSHASGSKKYVLYGPIGRAGRGTNQLLHRHSEGWNLCRRRSSSAA